MFTINTGNLGSKGNHSNITYGNQNIRHSISNHSIDGITVTGISGTALVTIALMASQYPYQPHTHWQPW